MIRKGCQSGLLAEGKLSYQMRQAIWSRYVYTLLLLDKQALLLQTLFKHYWGGRLL